MSNVKPLIVLFAAALAGLFVYQGSKETTAVDQAGAGKPIVQTKITSGQLGMRLAPQSGTDGKG